MRRKLVRILVVLVLLTLPLLGWRAYLAHGIGRQLSRVRAAKLPANGNELNQWYADVAANENAALALTEAFRFHCNYADNRSNLIHDFQLPEHDRPLTPDEIGLLEGYLELNAALLARADEALELPSSRYPVDFRRLMHTALPHLHSLRDLAELHAYAACLAMASDRPETASDHIVKMLALTRTLDTEPTMISQLARIKLIGLAFSTLEHRANFAEFSSTELVALATAFNAAQSSNVAVRALIGERAMLTPYFRMTKSEVAALRPEEEAGVARDDSPLPCHGPAILRLIGYYDMDYLSFLRGMERGIEMAGRPPPANLAMGHYLAQMGEASKNRQRTISGMVFSAYAGVAQRETECIAQHRMVGIAMSVERFRNQNGRFPAALGDPGFDDFAEELEDPFTGDWFEYRLTDKGYILCSVGPDRQHDKDRTVSPDIQSGRALDSDDITFIVER